MSPPAAAGIHCKTIYPYEKMDDIELEQEREEEEQEDVHDHENHDEAIEYFI